MPRSGKPRKKADSSDDVPLVFRDMLAETETSLPVQTDDEGKAVKRRRVGGRMVSKVVEDKPEYAGDRSTQGSDDVQMSNDLDELFEERPELIKSDSDDSADSDMAWEEVDLQHHETEIQAPDPQDSESPNLDLVLGSRNDHAAQTPKSIKRKPKTLIEKKICLDIHKLHLCCLLVHVSIRNHWCNDEIVHTSLQRALSKKIIFYLNPGEDKSQFQRSRSFMDGVEQASESFRSKFKIVARGMSRPAWAESPDALARSQPPTDIDLPMQRADFRSAAQDMKASRDVGAQLFCALLRSVGVDTRLVCSLQVLPISPPAPAAMTPQKGYAAYYSAEEREKRSTPEVDSDLDNKDDTRSSERLEVRPLGGRTRFQPDAADVSDVQPTKSPLQFRGKIRESKYPVYWVEAFNEATQKWVPIDPLVTKTVAKPTKFEPPAGDRDNNLTYVIAFEDDSSARDVTRRYAKAYNAKTRRDRVESVKEGERWWKKVLKIYRRSHYLDRDQVDDAELARKEAAEPMPKNVQDFKDHPYYALERHLRRHEVIHPKREVGKVGAGKSGESTVLEPIYRRRDVQIVQSGDKWYRSMGREIKPGEQPLKRVSARRNREQSLEPDMQGQENAGTALYAIHQTTPYKAPPVINGRISKNLYGNLDVYVPSMVPSGGTHIEHPETVRAARVLGIEFAEAVTGFAFKGRHGTAITKGAIIASEHREAVEEVLAAFEDERLQAEEERRSYESMRLWKRFLAGLRIRERIEGYDVEGERDATQEVRDEMVEAEDDEDDEGGGFFPGQEDGCLAKPTAGKPFEEQLETNQQGRGGFVIDAVNQGENTENSASDRSLHESNYDGGGGFLVEDDDSKDAEQALHASVEHDAVTQTPNSLLVRSDTQPTFHAPEPSKGVAIDRTVEEQPVLVNSNTDEAQQGLRHHVSCLRNEFSQEEPDEARMLQELHEEEQELLPDSVEETRASIRPLSQSIHSNGSGDAIQSAEMLPRIKQADSIPIKSPSTQVSSPTGSPKSDKGSLLSEDPEDEDAEPEWLV